MKQQSAYKKMFGYGPIGVIISAIMFTLALWIDASLAAPKIDMLVAWILATIFFALFVIALIYIMMSLPMSKRGSGVIRKGIYGKLRHPLYSAGVFLFYPSIAFFTRSWIVLVTTLVVFRIFSVVARAEEFTMIRLFGEEYKQYMQEVGGFFPKVIGRKKH